MEIKKHRSVGEGLEFSETAQAFGNYTPTRMKTNIFVTEVKYIESYKLWIELSDASSGFVDLEKECWGEMFLPLSDLSFFCKVFLHPESRTLTWPNGADFSPEYLKSLIQLNQPVKV